MEVTLIDHQNGAADVGAEIDPGLVDGYGVGTRCFIVSAKRFIHRSGRLGGNADQL